MCRRWRGRRCSAWTTSRLRLPPSPGCAPPTTLRAPDPALLAWALLAFWGDESGLVGPDDRVNAVPEVELGQDMPDVDLDRAFRLVQAGKGPAVGLALAR